MYHTQRVNTNLAPSKLTKNDLVAHQNPSCCCINGTYKWLALIHHLLPLVIDDPSQLTFGSASLRSSIYCAMMSQSQTYLYSLSLFLSPRFPVSKGGHCFKFNCIVSYRHYHLTTLYSYLPIVMSSKGCLQINTTGIMYRGSMRYRT